MKSRVDFDVALKEAVGRKGYCTPVAYGIGLAARGKGGRVLEVYYHAPAYHDRQEIAAIIASAVNHLEGNASYSLSKEAVEKLNSTLAGSPFAKDANASLLAQLPGRKCSAEPIVTFLSEDVAPKTVEDVYLKLALLSHRLVRPHGVNLDGLFNILPNVAWTSEGAVEIEELAERQLSARLNGETLEVFSVDKFPKMINHVVPSQIRIADGARVRFGAHLGPGTTVMQAGFVNFNAGTAGPNMIEGRVSAGVFVDSGSDLGGASSTLGTLSGGNKTVIHIGRNCLIGANAGAGISLGDNSTIEAGLYVTAGSKVELLDKTGKRVGLVKAKELAGKPGLLFRRNSSTGQIEALEGKATAQLNDSLHVNR